MGERRGVVGQFTDFYSPCFYAVTQTIVSFIFFEKDIKRRKFKGSFILPVGVFNSNVLYIYIYDMVPKGRIDRVTYVLFQGRCSDELFLLIC